MSKWKHLYPRDYVYCINNRGVEGSLTIHKKYEILPDEWGYDDENFQFKILNDKGFEMPYSNRRFASIEKWRDIQLRKLI